MKKKYVLKYDIIYYSETYDKTITVEKGRKSDGATGAFDIWSEAWWVHDKLCEESRWDDGTPCTNYQASQVLGDILKKEGRWMRSFYWRWATFFFRKLLCKN